MTQVDAARLLSQHFYEMVRSHANPGPDSDPNLVPHVRTPAGALRLPTKCSADDMQRRRDELEIPREFAFAWFDLPVGAHYVRPCPDCTSGKIESCNGTSALFITQAGCGTCLGERFVPDGEKRRHPMEEQLSAEARERIARAVGEREALENSSGGAA